MTEAQFNLVRLLAGDSNSIRRRFGGATEQRFYDEEIREAFALEGTCYGAAALLWEATAGSNALLSLAFGTRVSDADGIQRASGQALAIAARLRARAAESMAAEPTVPRDDAEWSWDFQEYLQGVLCTS